MTVIVIIKDEFEGKAFATKCFEEDTYLFKVKAVVDKGDQFYIVPDVGEDDKLRWFWSKRTVKYIGVFP